MDKKYIEENGIVTKYLRGQLTPEETSEFEAYFLDKPEIIEQLELDSILIKNTGRAFENLQRAGIRNRWLNLTQIVSAMAAGALLVVILPSMVAEKEVNLEGAQIEYFETFRSSETRPQRKLFDVSSEIENLVLVIEVNDTEDT